MLPSWYFLYISATNACLALSLLEIWWLAAWYTLNLWHTSLLAGVVWHSKRLYDCSPLWTNLNLLFWKMMHFLCFFVCPSILICTRMTWSQIQNMYAIWSSWGILLYGQSLYQEIILANVWYKVRKTQDFYSHVFLQDNIWPKYVIHKQDKMLGRRSENDYAMK